MCFEKLRKRYNNKKNDTKKAKNSGSSTRESEKAEKALEDYKFLFWLGKFFYIQEGRSNVPRDLAMTMKMKMTDMPLTSIFLTKVKAMTRKKKTILKTVELLLSYHLLIVEPAPLHHLNCCLRKIQHLPKERQTPQIKQPTKKRGKDQKINTLMKWN